MAPPRPPPPEDKKDREEAEPMKVLDELLREGLLDTGDLVLFNRCEWMGWY
jgi:hypothetical protein